jgi:pimeloyl-ACP methyl ester carboxylesterase
LYFSTKKEQRPSMIRNIAKILLLQAVLLSACVPRNTPVAETPGITLTKCALNMPEIDLQVDARCGTLLVPEDRSNPGSRQIDLNIAVVEAVSRRAKPDPLFVLVGGPGQSAVESFPALYSAFYKIHQSRDIVLVDQRGTGKSNPLRCLDPQQEDISDEQAIVLLKDCPGKLDADLRFYTTDIAMQDLDQVRAALGYETIDLYGVSYGTRAALVYLKMFPKHVRSLVLDGVVDPSFILYQDSARDGQTALDLVFQRCQDDQACASAYPHLQSEFDEMLQTLKKTPAQVSMPHPLTGRPLQLTLTESMVSSHVFNMLYSPDLAAMLPFVIHQAYESGNYAPLITQGYLADAGVYDGMFYAVTCAEDSQLVQPGQDDGIFGGNLHNFLEVCRSWPGQEAPAIIHAPVTSDVPVLILSGEADPITPPWHAEKLHQALPNSLHVIFPGMGHGNGPSECGSRLMANFIEAASVTDLDVSCAQAVAPAPFFVDFSGPKP